MVQNSCCLIKPTFLICTIKRAILPYSPSQTSLLTSFPQKTKSLNIASVTLWANPSPLRYLWVCPYSRLQLFFQAALFHLNFNPIYGLSFSPRLPGAIKLFIQRTSCHPALS